MIARHPLLKPSRISSWIQCLREGSSPQIKDNLAIKTDQTLWIARNARERYLGEEWRTIADRWTNVGGNWYVRPANWVDLDKVADFLRAQTLGDGELTCYCLHATYLYLELDIRPPTRLPFLGVVISMYPAVFQQQLIQDQLNHSHQRFVVTDVREVGLDDSNLEPEPGKELELPSLFPKEKENIFPWNEPIVFRAGPYFVHRVTQGRPVGPLVEQEAQK
jgi:hypothetical protein